MDVDSSQRYWMAGCMTFGDGDFEFLPVNRFTNTNPIESETLHCHHLVSLHSAGSSDVDTTLNIRVKEAASSFPVAGASVHVSLNDDSSYQELRQTDDNGVINLKLNQNGEYTVRVEDAAYIPAAEEVEISCSDGDSCSVSTLLSPSRKMETGLIRLIMNWGEVPRDLDLYVFQVSKDNAFHRCITSTHSQDSCNGVSMNVDNKAGGLEGAETVTIQDMTLKHGYTYMVYVDDNSGKGTSLDSSKARITVTDGQNSMVFPMPNFDQSTPAGARYWFAGCMDTSADSYSFVPQERFTNDKPSVEDPLECHNLFGGDSTLPIAAMIEVPNNAYLNLVVKDGLSNLAIASATASVDKIKGTSVTSIAKDATANDEGIITLPIQAGEKYAITVKSDGYVTDAFDLTLSCDGAGCYKTVLVSLSPDLVDDCARIIMNWDSLPKDLDLHVFRVNINNTEESCTTNWLGKNCQGLSLDLDNRDGGDKGAETITFGKEDGGSCSVHENYVDMIYVDDHSEQPKEFRSSSTRLTITDGKQTITEIMDPTNYQTEQFWLAGCLRAHGDSFEYKKVGVFLEKSPNTEIDQIKLQCFKEFKLPTEPTVELRKGDQRGTNSGNVFVNGKPVCDNGWNNKDAKVICRMLGFRKVGWSKATTSSKFGEVPTDFIMDNVGCRGNEKNILKCPRSPSRVCSAMEGAGVICKT